MKRMTAETRFYKKARSFGIWFSDLRLRDLTSAAKNCSLAIADLGLQQETSQEARALHGRTRI